MLCWLPCNYRATFPQQMKKIKQRLEYIFLHLAPVPFHSFAQQTGSPERSLLVGQPFSKTQECLHTISYNFTRTTKKIEKSVKHWTTNGIKTLLHKTNFRTHLDRDSIFAAFKFSCFANSFWSCSDLAPSICDFKRSSSSWFLKPLRNRDIESCEKETKIVSAFLEHGCI